MTKVGTIALVATSLLVGLSSTPAFAFSERALTAGEKEARHLMRLMDKDTNGQVSRAEFMQFMEAEFDRLDRDRSGQLSSEEFSRIGIHYGHKTTVSRR
jgi:Ca2+-binding EF-hand superfamily protein